MTALDPRPHATQREPCRPVAGWPETTRPIVESGVDVRHATAEPVGTGLSEAVGLTDFATLRVTP